MTIRIQNLPFLFLGQYEPDSCPGKIDTMSCQSKGSDESSIDHTEEVIIG